MVTKVLFFDTSALLKLFVTENGSDNIRWLCNPSTKSAHRLHFVINKQVDKEFFERIDSFINHDRITRKEGNLIKTKFSRSCKNKLFRVIGQSIISNTKYETSIEAVLEKLSLIEGKNDLDGFLYQSMVNALAYLGGKSHPILVSADRGFIKKVQKHGFRVINPLLQDRSEIEKIIS